MKAEINQTCRRVASLLWVLVLAGAPARGQDAGSLAIRVAEKQLRVDYLLPGLNVTWNTTFTVTDLRPVVTTTFPGFVGFISRTDPANDTGIRYKKLVLQDSSIVNGVPMPAGTRSITYLGPGQWEDKAVRADGSLAWSYAISSIVGLYDQLQGAPPTTETSIVQWVFNVSVDYDGTVTQYTINRFLSDPVAPETTGGDPYSFTYSTNEIPNASRFGSTTFSAQYHLSFPPGIIGTIRWLEVFTPASDPDHPQYTAREWTVDGTTSPEFNLAAPADGSAVVVPYQSSIAVDANRDGQIKLATEDATDVTSADKPFRFWLNDDIDRGHTVDGNDYEQDDISPTEATANNWVEDWKSNKVGFTRDLEDFARIVVSTSGLSDAFRNGDLYMGLKWTDTAGAPSIKLYKQYDATGGTSYLTDDYQASVQLVENAILNQRYPSDDVALSSAHTVVTPGDVFVLPQALWFGLSGDALKRSLLFEGCTAGTGQLKLVILKRDGTNYTEIGDGPGVWLDLKNIKDMYEHWTVGQGPVPNGGGAPGALSQASSFTYTAQSPEESKYILYVHGWNMEQWEKERFAETAYKRLYWQGYKGRFGLFSWSTTNGFDGIRSAITDSTNYDRGEFSAWRSASLLEQKLAQLNSNDQYPNQVYLLAHSMGNVVAGEALRRAGQDGLGVIVRTYVASQAALPVHCYNGSLSDNLDADVPASGIVRAFDGGWPQTTNAYKSWLTANSAAVAKRVNFFNINDYALWRDVWQLNQWLKPDHPDLRANPPDPQRTYAYLDDISQPPTQDGFGWLRPGGQVDPSDRPSPYVSGWWYATLRLGNAVDVKDRYEIMAMACESRSKALGATQTNEGLEDRVWLGSSSVWPDDPSGDARSYSRHKWHSAQFRSTNMLQRGYWQTLLGPQGFNISTQP